MRSDGRLARIRISRRDTDPAADFASSSGTETVAHWNPSRQPSQARGGGSGTVGAGEAAGVADSSGDAGGELDADAAVGAGEAAPGVELPAHAVPSRSRQLAAAGSRRGLTPTSCCTTRRIRGVPAR